MITTLRQHLFTRMVLKHNQQIRRNYQRWVSGKSSDAKLPTNEVNAADAVAMFRQRGFRSLWCEDSEAVRIYKLCVRDKYIDQLTRDYDALGQEQIDVLNSKGNTIAEYPFGPIQAVLNHANLSIGLLTGTFFIGVWLVFFEGIVAIVHLVRRIV